MKDQEVDYLNLISILESQNPAIKQSLSQMRYHGIAMELGKLETFEEARMIPIPMRRHVLRVPMRFEFAEFALKPRFLIRIWTLVLLLIGLVALGVVIGPYVFRFVVQYWRILLLCISAACIGASVVLVLSRVGIKPLRGIQPPSADTDEPLKELEGLAERTAVRLKTAYTVQVSLVVAVFTIFAGIVAWSMVMISQKRLAYASAFGSGGVAMLVLSKWKWQPFDRIARARKLADQADILATALRMRIRTIEQIGDPATRAKAQWEAVAEYLKLS